MCVLVPNMVLTNPPATAPLQARRLCWVLLPQSIRLQHNLQTRTCNLVNNFHHVLLPHPRIAPCHAFVGEQSNTAGEYHSQDFNWEICIEEGAAAVKRQRQEWHTRAHEQLTDINSKDIKENKKINNDLGSASNFAMTASEAKGVGWEAFHQRHAAARFFKEKRYIPLAFPALMKPDIHVAEIGCGCGSALLPVLKANPAARVTACDVSPTAIELLKVAAERERIDLNRIHSFPYDASIETTTQTIPEINSITTQEQGTTGRIQETTKSTAGGPLAGLNADYVLMIFTLSALWPKDMLCMLRHAYHALRPGGLLLFRDYGLYDMAQLRFPGSQLLDPGESLVYQRLDGTLSSFFSIGRMEKLAHDAGLQVVECEYVTTFIKNRKKKTELKRVFVHGVFKKEK